MDKSHFRLASLFTSTWKLCFHQNSRLTFKTSRLKSVGSVTLSVILVPWGSIPPPDLTSLVLWPQKSQTVAMMTTSLKCGISGTHNLRKNTMSNQTDEFQLERWSNFLPHFVPHDIDRAFYKGMGSSSWLRANFEYEIFDDVQFGWTVCNHSWIELLTHGSLYSLRKKKRPLFKARSFRLSFQKDLAKLGGKHKLVACVQFHPRGPEMKAMWSGKIVLLCRKVMSLVFETLEPVFPLFWSGCALLVIFIFVAAGALQSGQLVAKVSTSFSSCSSVKAPGSSTVSSCSLGGSSCSCVPWSSSWV